MQYTHRLITTAVLMALSSLAAAQEGVPDYTWVTASSTRSRAEVQAETLAALRRGSLPRTDESFPLVTVPSGSSLTRAQVRAETMAALRLGLIPVHDGHTRLPTAAENEQVRQAGQRALEASSQLAAK